MTQPRHRATPSLATRITARVAVVAAILITTAPAAAQTTEWRLVDNPYQEDVEYTIGGTFKPGVVVEGVRWRSFTVQSPDSGLIMDGESVETEVVVEFENRGTKSARVLVILLLEDEDGNPLDRVQVRPFKIAGGRLKERTETIELASEVIDSARRAYLFFEIME